MEHSWFKKYVCLITGTMSYMQFLFLFFKETHVGQPVVLSWTYTRKPLMQCIKGRR